MNCQRIRNRVLAVDDPARLPEEFAAHFEECAACQAWHRKVIAVERALVSLPVPESDGLTKIALLERLRVMPLEKKPKAAPVSPEPSANHKPLGASGASPLNLADDLPPNRFALEKFARLWPAGLVAATLLIGAVAWFSLHHTQTPVVVQAPADPMLDKLVKLNVELVNGKQQGPAERVTVLAGIADELHHEMRDIARADASGENMEALKEMYRKVVLNGLVAQASQLGGQQGKEVRDKIVNELASAGQEAERTADEAPEHSAGSLRDAARIAREGMKQIRQIQVMKKEDL